MWGSGRSETMQYGEAHPKKMDMSGEGNRQPMGEQTGEDWRNAQMDDETQHSEWHGGCEQWTPNLRQEHPPNWTQQNIGQMANMTWTQGKSDDYEDYWKQNYGNTTGWEEQQERIGGVSRRTQGLSLPDGMEEVNSGLLT